MKYFDRFRKAEKPLTATAKQPENFYLAVMKYKARPNCSVRYKHRKQPGYLPLHKEIVRFQHIILNQK